MALSWLSAGRRLTAALLSQAVGSVIVKGATESVTSSTTLQTDDHFVHAVSANAVYTMNAYIIYDGAAATAGGLKLQFTVPSGASLTWTNFGVNGAGSGTLTEYNVVTEQAGAASPRGVGTNSTTQMSCRPCGILITSSTSGNLSLLWAQFTSNATATRIIGTSFLELKRVA